MLVVEFCFGALSSLLFKNLYHLSTVLSTKYTSIPKMSEWLVYVIKYTTVIFRIEGFELAVHASGFLVTRGTSHRGVGMRTSLLSWSQHVFTYCCLTDWLWGLCDVQASCLWLLYRHTQNCSLPSLSFPLLSGSWKMRQIKVMRKGGTMIGIVNAEFGFQVQLCECYLTFVYECIYGCFMYGWCIYF